MSYNFKQRLKISSFAVPLLLITLYLSSFTVFMPLFTLVITAIIATALWEYYQIAEAKGLQPLTALGIASSCAYIIALFLKSQFAFAADLTYIVIGISLVLAFGYSLRRGNSPLITLAITIFGLVYLTIPLGYLISINFFFPPDAVQDGRWWLLYLLTTIKMTDIGGFIVGKLFGKTQLAPLISPRKTWEGAFGGFAAGIATSICFLALVNSLFVQSPISLTWRQGLWLGLALSILAQFGDLAESLLKRDAGVKDSSYIPGLGGVLDIVDSLVFAVPFLYLYMVITN